MTANEITNKRLLRDNKIRPASMAINAITIGNTAGKKYPARPAAITAPIPEPKRLKKYILPMPATCFTKMIPSANAPKKKGRKKSR